MSVKVGTGTRGTLGVGRPLSAIIMLRLGSIRASRLAVQNSCAFATASTGSHSFLTIQPTFTVKDWALAEPVMADFVQRTQTEKGCMYYGWSTCGEKLFCREAYVDAVAVLDHLENIAESVGKMLDGPATLDKIELHGPLAELAKCKDAMDPLGCEYWEVDQGFSCMSKLAGASQTPQSLVTIQPTFCIKDWAAAAPIMEDFTARTASETGCVYYGWTKREGKLF